MKSPMMDALLKAREVLKGVKKEELSARSKPKMDIEIDVMSKSPNADEMDALEVDPSVEREKAGMNDELQSKDGKMLKVVNTGSPETESVAEDMGEGGMEEPHESEAMMLKRLMAKLK